MNKWIVHVTNFGKIEKADIQVAPFILFLGDNNSGKSYMMTLIYGLLKSRFFFDGFRFYTESDAYQKCCEILQNIIKNRRSGKKNRYTLSDIEIKAFEDLLNLILEKEKVSFLERVFNKKIEIGKLCVEFMKDTRYEFTIIEAAAQEEGKIRYSIRAIDKKISSSSYGYTTECEGEFEVKLSNFFISYILEYMLRKDFVVFDGLGDVKYFPTARTGFLLTYKALVENAFQETFNQKESYKTLLTRPNVDFLSNLSKLSVQQEQMRYQDIVEFIEQKLIVGKIDISDMPTHDILYEPNDSTDKLPLYVTSGVVTEITPLLLMLKYSEVGTLLIEEPEISLHPGLQLEMARLMIRIVNKGIPVFVTTHSDIIVQHINNMLKANDLEKKEAFLEKFNYETVDLLQCENVVMYQFDVMENQKTQVTKVQCGDYGFEAMTFFESLKYINDQIDMIDIMKNAEEEA